MLTVGHLWAVIRRGPATYFVGDGARLGQGHGDDSGGGVAGRVLFGDVAGTDGEGESEPGQELPAARRG
jgi:hypothetical protein